MAESPEFYYNSRTGEVEEGPQSGASQIYGPFPSREEAARAPERLRERAAAWAEEERAEDEA